jgi:hypothetical protein
MTQTIRLKLLTLIALLGVPTLSFAVELDQYKQVARGVVVGIGRGLTITDDELETARTEEFSIGIQLTNALRFSVPFSSYQVDTRGHTDDILPIGTLDVKTVGIALTLGGRGRWSPFIGIGGNFYSFDERFNTPANIQNAFGAEAHIGLRRRLINNIFDAAQLHGAIGYGFSFLKPAVSVPDRPEVEDLSLIRHSVIFRLELTGL